MLRRALGFACFVVFVSGSPGCSLGNVAHNDCSNNTECEGAFGLGSACQNGYCTTPPRCEAASDCNALFGGGACVKNVCSADCEAERADGIPCYGCKPQKPSDVLNTCTDAECVPFDNTRVTKLVDGKLPPLPVAP